MQNIQLLTQTGGVNKYVCKYIGKIDEQNYIVVYVDNERGGHLVMKVTFLHNTKVASSKMGEDKKRAEKGSILPTGTMHLSHGNAVSHAKVP